MKSLKKILIWAKANWKLLLLSAVALGLIISYLLSKRTVKSANLLKNDLNIIKKQKEICTLEAKKASIKIQISDVNKEIEDLDKKIANNKQDISLVEARNKKLAMKEKLEKLKKLGY
jgi:peptidoglycan hydrolase CwlO-like protein